MNDAGSSSKVINVRRLKLNDKNDIDFFMDFGSNES